MTMMLAQGARSVGRYVLEEFGMSTLRGGKQYLKMRVDVLTVQLASFNAPQEQYE